MKLGWVGWNGREVAPLALPTPSYPLCLTYAHIATSVFLTCIKLRDWGEEWWFTFGPRREACLCYLQPGVRWAVLTYS